MDEYCERADVFFLPFLKGKTAAYVVAFETSSWNRMLAGVSTKLYTSVQNSRGGWCSCCRGCKLGGNWSICTVALVLMMVHLPNESVVVLSVNSGFYSVINDASACAMRASEMQGAVQYKCTACIASCHIHRQLITRKVSPSFSFLPDSVHLPPLPALLNYKQMWSKLHIWGFRLHIKTDIQ